MASSKADMNDFFKKKKKAGGITKSKANAKSTSALSKKASSKQSASCGSDIAQPLAFVSHGSPDLLQDNYDEKEDMLRQFDMNMAYGPCIGMNRLDRWVRAKALGLDPPDEVERLMKSGKARVECLWNGCV